jgi:MerR family transcriptional regulator, copper efflux regulator
MYRIGQLAKLSNLSARTIDYYTKLGLIQPEQRTDSNYRLYSDETLARLKRIEAMKKEKYTLEEIKESFEQWGKVSRDEQVTEKLTLLQLRMQQLEKDVKELQPMIGGLKPTQSKALFQNLTAQSAACIEALLFFLGKGPLI